MRVVPTSVAAEEVRPEWDAAERARGAALSRAEAGRRDTVGHGSGRGVGQADGVDRAGPRRARLRRVVDRRHDDERIRSRHDDGRLPGGSQGSPDGSGRRGSGASPGITCTADGLTRARPGSRTSGRSASSLQPSLTTTVPPSSSSISSRARPWSAMVTTTTSPLSAGTRTGRCSNKTATARCRSERWGTQPGRDPEGPACRDTSAVQRRRRGPSISKVSRLRRRGQQCPTPQ